MLFAYDWNDNVILVLTTKYCELFFILSVPCFLLLFLMPSDLLHWYLFLCIFQDYSLLWFCSPCYGPFLAHSGNHRDFSWYQGRGCWCERPAAVFSPEMAKELFRVFKVTICWNKIQDVWRSVSLMPWWDLWIKQSLCNLPREETVMAWYFFFLPVERC